MSKRDKKRKQKKQQQQGSDEYSGVGLLSSMRGGFKNVVGTGPGQQGPKNAANRIKDLVFWALIIAVLMLLFYRFGLRR
ncbi:MAG: hypothetical protein HY901_00375 [Deltaproteobacteria bacterium]|nr:hypothetical protein [Deltaproteobacteria bacterium]